jgi:hypothetical protein
LEEYHDVPERKDCRLVFFVLSGYAFADGLIINLPEEMTVANLEPMPMELVSPVPDPLRYLHRYEMEFQASQGRPYYGQLDGFHSAQVTHEFRFGTGRAIPMPEPAVDGAATLHRRVAQPDSYAPCTTAAEALVDSR